VEFGTPQSITSSAGTITFNDLDSGMGLGLPPNNGYLLTEVVGNETPELRVPTENRPRAHGGLIHPFFKASKLIVIQGLIVASAPEHRTTLDDHLRTVTDPMLRADGTYTWAIPPYPYATTRFHTVRLYNAVTILGQTQETGMGAAPKLFHIELIAYKTNTEVY
jgi:hypothetical protein